MIHTCKNWHTCVTWFLLLQMLHTLHDSGTTLGVLVQQQEVLRAEQYCSIHMEHQPIEGQEHAAHLASPLHRNAVSQSVEREEER